MEKEFLKFLKGNKNVEEFKSNKSSVLVSKVKYNDKIDILYSLRGYNGELFDLKSSFDYAGMYDKEHELLYDLSFTIKNNILHWDYYDERIVTIDSIRDAINKEMNERIHELVEYSKDDLFDLKNAELGEDMTFKDVLSDFISGETSNTLKDLYKCYISDKSQNILDYLTDKETFLEEESRNFILDNHAEILRGLTITREKRKVLKQIEEDNTHPYHKIKAILDSIKDKNYVTVTITANKDGKELTFKYDAHALEVCYDSTLSSWNVSNVKDRHAFDEAYGWESIRLTDITKITYGKNTIYEDDNFKYLEEGNELS